MKIKKKDIEKEEDSKVDNELLYNILISMGQNRVEEFYGKNN